MAPAMLLLFLSFLMLELPNAQDIRFIDDSDTAESGCVTTDGESQGEECIFPFKFQDKEYSACITIADPELIPWCSTKVDADGRHVVGGGFWGHCSESCPVWKPDQSEQQPAEAAPEVTCVTHDGQPGVCKSPSICAGVLDLEIEKTTCDKAMDAKGELADLVCCKEILKNNVASFISGGDDNRLDSSPAPPPNVTVDDISKRFSFEEPPAAVAAASPAARPDAPEEVDFNLDEEDVRPEDLHLRFLGALGTSVSIDQAAQKLNQVAGDIKDEKNLTDLEAGIGLRSFDSDIVEAIAVNCPWSPEPICDRNAKYRSADGRCNNLKQPNFGRAGTPFQRILDPDYGDQTFSSPRKAKNGLELPSARKLSTSLTTDKTILSPSQSLIVMQMGQFIDHDLTHTPSQPFFCCNSDGTFPGLFDGELCYPIDVPADDPFWKGRRTCLSFSRSLTAPTLKCGLGFKQQMNQISHWLDASNIYGSSETQQAKLREKSGGRLLTSTSAKLKDGMLPSCSRNRNIEVEMCSSCDRCFFAGDGRANEHLDLLVMHNVWMKEHNRVAFALQRLNPKWDDEKLFQEARRIVTAEYQHIIYQEWLPAIVGNQYMTTFGLWPLSKGYSDHYQDFFDPRITNEFATAAFRFGHTLIPSKFDLVNPARPRQGKSVLVTSRLDLKSIFFRPEMALSNPVMLDQMLGGLTTQTGQEWDNSFVKDITDHLFESKPGAGGLDLVALNIQRGRDHGIRGYIHYREICGLGTVQTWEDLHDHIPPSQVEKLRSVYSDVSDVDLFVGGFLEKPHEDALIGATFKCIIGDTFARLKLGDRFFYDLPSAGFTPEQLDQIRKASMSRILCDNSDSLASVQPQVFRLEGSSPANTAQFCGTSPNIPKVNLAVFQDQGQKR